jgi:hypothetical protein
VDERNAMIGNDQPTDGRPAIEASTEAITGDRSAQSPTAHVKRPRPRQFRRVPKPRMTGLPDSPVLG